MRIYWRNIVTFIINPLHPFFYSQSYFLFYFNVNYTWKYNINQIMLEWPQRVLEITKNNYTIKSVRVQSYHLPTNQRSSYSCILLFHNSIIKRNRKSNKTCIALHNESYYSKFLCVLFFSSFHSIPFQPFPLICVYLT